jgi:putative ABC transport system permease protein
VNFSEAILVALSSLRANVLRSVLTLLGIIIGVMAVISVVSIISGLNDYVAHKILNLGPDVMTITRAQQVIRSVDEWVENQRRKNLVLADLDGIREACRHCKLFGASIGARASVKFGREYVDSQIQGYTADVPTILGSELQSGRFLTQYDIDHARNVCVIGSDVAETLFPFVDPIGKTLSLDGRPFEIIGVGKKQGSVFGQSRDNWATIPISLHYKMFGSRRSVTLYAKALDEKHLPAAESEVRLRLRTRRHVSYSAKDDFAINTAASFLEIWSEISRAFFAVMVGVVSISLIVGGIVVMNIMLVSVSERTHEIGVRKAVGARRRDIMIQFLVESATLTLVGGIIGILLGSAIALAIAWYSPLPASIQWWAVALGLTISTTVGLFFGIYPATKAANLDPIEALRYE